MPVTSTISIQISCQYMSKVFMPTDLVNIEPHVTLTSNSLHFLSMYVRDKLLSTDGLQYGQCFNFLKKKILQENFIIK